MAKPLESLERLQRENARLKTVNEYLLKQLEQEAVERESTGVHKRREWDEDDDETPRAPRCKRETSSVPSAASAFEPGPCYETVQTTILQEDGRSGATKHTTRPTTEKTDGAWPPKRKRRDQDDIDEDLEYLKLSSCPEPSGARSKKKRMATAIPNDKSEQVFSFDFQAISEWHDDAPQDQEPYSYIPLEDIRQCEFLVQRIRKTQDIWENNCGSEWQYDFQKSSSKMRRPVCVSAKTAGRKTRWRYGDKEGRYACFDCVMSGRPCFRYTGVEGRGFELLPLHKEDRKRSVIPGKTEMRYWVNDHTAFSAADAWIGGEEDEDYSE